MSRRRIVLGVFTLTLNALFASWFAQLGVLLINPHASYWWGLAIGFVVACLVDLVNWVRGR